MEDSPVSAESELDDTHPKNQTGPLQFKKAIMPTTLTLKNILDEVY